MNLRAEGAISDGAISDGALIAGCVFRGVGVALNVPEFKGL